MTLGEGMHGGGQADFNVRLAALEDGIAANREPHLLARDVEALRPGIPQDPELRLRFLIAQATVENRDGVDRQALATLFEARRLAASEPGLASFRPAISRLFATVHSWRGQSEAAATELMRAFAEASAIDSARETAMVLAESGRASKEAGRFDAALLQFGEALRHEALPEHERARAIVGRMQALNALSRHAECIAEAEAGAPLLAGQTGRLRLLHQLEHARAIAATGDVAAAQGLLADARRFLPADENAWSHADWHAAETDIELRDAQARGRDHMRGMIATLRETIRRTLEPAEEQRLHARVCAARLTLSELARIDGDTETALAEAGRALRIAHRERLPALVERARGALLACDHLRVGQADETADLTILPERYVLCEVLGRGGYGEVRRAFSLETGEELALKSVSLERVTDPRRRAMLARDAHAELERAGRVRHPGLVGIRSVFIDKAAIIVAQDYVKGRSLAEVRNENRQRPELIGLFVQIAHALQALHAAGIAHRDLKPQNVIVDPAGRAVIIDFGLASLAGKDSGFEMPRGTAGYAAPELWSASGDRITQPLLDIFALGVMLRETVPGLDVSGLSGRFSGDPLVHLVRAMTADDPARRPQSMQEIAAALESALAAAAAS